MDKRRLESLTDGVMAIIITIMVLELKTPAQASLASLEAEAPILFTYALSFVSVGIFWNNHHHLLHATERIDGRALWANLALLFWLSLVPFVIRWIDETRFQAVPTAAYGAILVMAAFAYALLERALMAPRLGNRKMTQALGVRRKELVSLLLYTAGCGLAFVRPWLAIALYVGVALMWLVPDRRIERMVRDP
jgi:uncharacterized membrane protein